MSSAWASFSPTPQELAYAQLLFNKADPAKLGIITGEAAIPLFAGSNLPPEKLSLIWAIADHDKNGFLSKKGVAVVVRLIGWAQYGEDVNDSLLLKCEYLWLVFLVSVLLRYLTCKLGPSLLSLAFDIRNRTGEIARDLSPLLQCVVQHQLHPRTVQSTYGYSLTVARPMVC